MAYSENDIWASYTRSVVHELREYAASIQGAFDRTRDILWNVKNGYYSLDYDTRDVLSYIRQVRRDSVSQVDAYKDALITMSTKEKYEGLRPFYCSLAKDIEGIITSLDHLILSATPYRAYELTFEEIDAIAEEGQQLADTIRDTASEMLSYVHETIRQEAEWNKTKWFLIIVAAILLYGIFLVVRACS